ncbi:hypothetical protein V8E52_004294 [Russula decolorans]
MVGTGALEPVYAVPICLHCLHEQSGEKSSQEGGEGNTPISGSLGWHDNPSKGESDRQRGRRRLPVRVEAGETFRWQNQVGVVRCLVAELRAGLEPRPSRVKSSVVGRHNVNNHLDISLLPQFRSAYDPFNVREQRPRVGTCEAAHGEIASFDQ